MLVTVLGAMRQPGVYEIAVGTEIGQVLELAGGRPRGIRKRADGPVG